MGARRLHLLLVLGICVLTAVSTADADPQKGTITGTLKNPFARKYPAAVYVADVPGAIFELPKAHPVMDQKNLVFTPHVLPVFVGSTIDFPNSDDVRHNVYTTRDSVCQFNLGTYPAGEVKRVRCDNVGMISLLCNVHAEMSGYIVVSPTPYFATTDTRGEFSIPDVPPGTYRLTFWHEKLASTVVEVAVEPGREAYVEFSGLERK